MATKTARSSKASTAFRGATSTASSAPGPSSGSRSTAATSASSRSSSATPASSSRWASARPSRATRTTRTSPAWSARSTSASSRPIAQDDPDAYSYSGGLCLANQGLLEFVEMFKAPIKVLHPLLTATQEGNFKGTEGFGAIPFDGVVLAHSNESEWKTFRNNKNNEAFLDRIYIVKVPYCLRVSEEVHIYEKLLKNSSLAAATCAPGTLKMMSQFAILTRLKEPENSSALQQDAGLRRREPEGHRPARQELPGVPRLRRRRRRHERHQHALCLQDPVQGLQLRQHRGGRQPGAPDVRAGAADRARAVPGRGGAEVPRLHQGAPGARATPSSSARRSRPPTWRATASTARTSSTATSPTPTTGSRTTSTATPTPARSSTAAA